LLAALTAVLADQRLSIITASGTLLPSPGIALERVTVAQTGGQPMSADDWDALGRRLKAVLGRHEASPRPAFDPTPPVTVIAHPQELGRALVTVEAPDRIGLLWAVASWFSEHDCNIEACQATSVDGMANDKFLVTGACDWTALATAISGTPVRSRRLPTPLRLAVRTGVVTAAVAAAIAVRVGGTVRRSS
jgi:UTP:GlnB (protein PII) uridylyltransferase